MKSKKEIFKIIILGQSGVGKTSLLNQYVSQKFSQSYRATIGADFLAKQVIVDGRTITLQIWDTAGQQRFRSLGSAFYRGSDCCVIVYDITNQDTFNKIQSWKKDFLNQGQPPQPQKFPMAILGNMLDMAHERKISQQKAKQLLSKNQNMIYFETSAKQDINVNAAFQAIARAAIKNQKQEDIFQPTMVKINNNKKMKPNKGCCSK